MAEYMVYDDKELDSLKRDIVSLDNNVEQYDRQIRACSETIQQLEENLKRLGSALNQNAPKKQRKADYEKYQQEEQRLNQQKEKLERLKKGRDKTSEHFTEKSERLERMTGQQTDISSLKDEVYNKQREREYKNQEKVQEKLQKERTRLRTQNFNKIMDVIKAINDIAKEFYHASIDIQINQMETLTKVTTEGMRALGKGVNASLSSSLKSITTGVQEAAYSSASAALETSTSMQEYLMNREQGLLKMENFREVRVAKAIASGIQGGATAIGTAIGTAVAPGLGTAIGGAIGWAIGEIGQWNATIKEGEAKLSEEQLQQLNEIKKTALEQGTSITSEINAFSNQIETLLGKNQAAAKNIQATMGMNTSAMAASESKLFSMQQQIGVKSRNGRWQHLDVGLEDMDKMQFAYSQASGRGIAYSLADYNKQAQIGNVVGSQDLASQLTAGMEIFNKSAEEGSDILFKMYKAANRMGLDARKYSKDLVKNMKLAEKYSFKGGVKGLMQMAAWAQKVGFNMDSLDSSLQKISEGGLEGVIKMGAEFQVLGGRAAMNADPIAMMYERYADPEAFGKRMHGMLKGLGSFNKETGEIDVRGGNLMMAEQIAKVRGVSTEDVLNEIRREGKREELDKVLSPGKYNEQQRNLLASKATYNAEKGNWEVVGADHQKHDINNLSNADFEAMAMSHDETLETYVYDILSEVKKMNGTTMEGQQKTMSRVRAEWEAQVDARMEEDKRFYEDSSDVLKGLITTSMQFATDMDRQQHEIFLKSQELFNEVNEVILGNARDFAKSIVDGNSQLRTAIRSLVPGATLSDSDKVTLGVMTEGEASAKYKTSKRYDNLNKEYNRKEGYWGNFAKGQDVATARAKYQSAYADEQFEKGDYLGGAWSKINAGATQTIGRAAQAIGNLFGADAASVDDFMNKPIFDGVVSSNNQPMTVSAASVTPIHDGTARIAKTDPQDTAIFAKTGGPFDKLFNDIFGRIDAVYNFLGGNASTSTRYGDTYTTSNNIRQQEDNVFRGGNTSNTHLGDTIQTSNAISQQWATALKEDDPILKLYEAFSPAQNQSVRGDRKLLVKALADIQGVSGKDMSPMIEPLPIKDTSPAIKEQWNNALQNTGTNMTSASTFDKPIDVNVHGDITLKSENGQTFDISRAIETDPLLVRTISQIITKHLSTAVYGGRGVSNMSLGSV